MLSEEEKEKLKDSIHKLLLEKPQISNNLLALKTVRNNLSKAITCFAFRNGPIEDMHTDRSKNITEEDMRILNKYMVDHIEIILELFAENNFTDIYLFSLFSGLYCSNWDDPDPNRYRDEYNSCIDLILNLGPQSYFDNSNINK